MRHLELIADGVIAACKSHVASALAPLFTRIEGLAKRLDELPTPKDGERGKDAVVDYDQIAKGVDERVAKAVADAVAALPTPAPGKDADETAVVQRVLAAIPTPKDGLPGKNADPVDTAAIIAAVIAQVPAPLNGKDADPEFVRAEIAKAVAEIPRPKDGEPGEPGKSIVIDDVRPLFDAAFASWALDFERRAADIFQRAIEKIPPPKDGIDGFSLHDLTIEDDGRGLVTLRFARGELVKTHEMQIPWPEDRGVFKEGETYRRGNGVTWGGSWFIAQKNDPVGKPGESDDWRLAVKRGRDGKDAAAEPKPREPVRVA